MIDLNQLSPDAKKKVEEFMEAFGNKDEWEKFEAIKPFIHDIYKLWVAKKLRSNLT